MKWYKHLYLGEQAADRQQHIISGVRFRKLQNNVYIIVLASDGRNLLEMYPSFVLLQDYYKRREFVVVGLAFGYTEGMEVIREIIHDTYSQTGGFDVRAFLGDERDIR